MLNCKVLTVHKHGLGVKNVPRVTCIIAIFSLLVLSKSLHRQPTSLFASLQITKKKCAVLLVYKRVRE